ncbi:MAG: hypothetical protein QOF89_3064 [Acidobacteriota bacterium]|nr:hypothetical protein [Acidobacteriota bacterium]
MDLITPFFLPVVRPPDKKISNTLAYYNDLQAQGVKVVAASPSPGSPLEIMIEKSDVLHPEPHEDEPVSTVFAMTSGFVSHQLGDIVLRVWTGDFDAITKMPDGPPRANRIIFGSLEPESIKVAIKKQIETLDDAILAESWTEAGKGPLPAREDLEAAFLQRFIDGDAEIFVDAGAPLGEASLTPATTNAPVVRLTLETFFDPAGPSPPVAVAPEDLIDNALRPRQLLKFAGHPLLRAISGPIQIHFLSRFLIWDNTPGVFDYMPLANTEVTLLAGPDLTNLPNIGITPDVEVATATSNAAGFIDLIAPPLPARALIHFRYATSGRTFGTRTYTEDVETNAHKARLHLNPSFENAKDYRAKYEAQKSYKDFTNDLADHEDDEKYGADRGNMGAYEKVLQPIALDLGKEIVPPITHRDLMRHIVAFEDCYKADTVPPNSKTFNLLVEGDSWLNYPFAFNDIYGHLDQIIWAKKKPDITYNRLPLQHYGDRSDQMFFANSPNADRQWTHTLDFLSEYKIDLILASSGGNDMAEPGIGAADKTLPDAYFADGYFDPFAAKGVLDPQLMATAEKLMRRSFAVLLKNHRWYSYFNPSVILKDEAAMWVLLEPLLVQLGKDFGPSNLVQQAKSPQEIGTKVIANFPDTFSPGSPEDLLIQAVFDPIGFGQRYIDVRTNWKILLDEATLRQIPVISHTYGYPLFNEEPTSVLGLGVKGRAGPWFNNRFKEAKISDRRIQKICLKAILDRFVTAVLNPLKAQYSLFDYVDIRNLNSAIDLWRDEMHLRGSGFRKIAEKVYEKIVANPKLSHFFVS